MKIDPEFRDLIPPLDEAEYKQLEANIRAEGCREALLLWNDILIDGHHRYRICTEHGIRFTTVSKEFPDRRAVKEWIIKNQWGRRNLTAYQRAVLALKLETTLGEQGKRNQSEAGKGLSILTKADTRKEIARVAGLSCGTIFKVKKIEEAASAIQKEQLRAGKVTISHIFSQVEGAETQAALTDAERTDAERQLIIRRCLVDLRACALTLERQGIDVSELRAWMDRLNGAAGHE
jgi:ParB-like chromosome segregation protein Spo0J